MKKPQNFADVVFLDLCRYISTDEKTGGARFCGSERDGKSAYCGEHRQLCCVKPKSINFDPGCES